MERERTMRRHRLFLPMMAAFALATARGPMCKEGDDPPPDDKGKGKDGGGGGSKKDDPPPKTFTQEEVGKLLADAREEAKTKGEKAGRKAVLESLKDLGIASEEELAELAKLGVAAKKEKQTVAERAAEAEKKADAAKAAAAEESKAAKREMAKARAIAKARPVDDEAFEALYDRAATQDGFDPEKWIEKQKTDRPHLFEAPKVDDKSKGGTQNKKAPANTTTNANNAPNANHGNGADEDKFDALTAKPEELAAWEAKQGLSRRVGVG